MANKLNNLEIGGGYGSTGVTVTDAGDVSANGTLTVDGVATFKAPISQTGLLESLIIGEGAGGTGSFTGTGRNVILGTDAGKFGTQSGTQLTLVGYEAGRQARASTGITAFGCRANRYATGNGNSAFGSMTMSTLTSGVYNSAFGSYSLAHITTQSNNSVFGANAGRYRGTGTDTNTDSVQGVYLGADTRAEASGGTTNEIVIGYNAVGAGSNTATLGNDSITSTRLKGEVQALGGTVVAGVAGTTRGQVISRRGTSTNTPGVIGLTDVNGNIWYLHADTSGNLRITNTLPTSDTSGTVVGP